MYTPDQFADLVISKLEAEHHARTGEFLNLATGNARNVLIEHFHMALTQAIEKSITVVETCAASKIGNAVPHMRKHLPE